MKSAILSAGESNDAHYDQVLRDLVDMATDIARMIHAQVARQASRQNQAATAALPPTSTPANDQFPDATLAFDRIGRTIRRTILLVKKLPELGRVQKPEDTSLRRIATRKRIIRRVEDVIQRNAAPHELETLQAEFRERLDSPDLEDEIDHRPIADIVIDICRDLRVLIPYAPNYKRRTPAQVETLRAQAAAIPEGWQEQKPRLPPGTLSETAAPPRKPAKGQNYAAGYAETRNREGIG